MWSIWGLVLSTLLLCFLVPAQSLESNRIRSSKEVLDQQQRSSCSNRSQRRKADRQVDRQVDRHKDTDRHTADVAEANRTRDPGSCVRSADCAPGSCCVRYLTGRRCQRVPLEGHACLLPGASKRRRNLERCPCGAGLVCGTGAALGAAAGAARQGVCLPGGPRQGRRNTRHSGERRRTAEGGC